LSSSLSGSFSFWKMAWTWRSTARGLRASCPAMARFERPSARSPRTSRSRSERGVEQGAAAPAHEARDDLRVEGGAALGDPLDGVDELGHVAHAVLEQVPDAGGVVAHELEHVGRLEVLGEDEDRDGRMGAADLRGGHEPVVGVAGRHADIDDCHVRDAGGDLPHEVVCVVRATHDLVAGLAQQRGDALAQQGVVVGDDHPQARGLQRRSVGGCNVASGHGSTWGEPRAGHRCA
jgi:hypothetical protein